jgi:DNA-binding transcriptional MerR regulator/quercetin dioxygenase-like cupin family protein
MSGAGGDKCHDAELCAPAHAAGREGAQFAILLLTLTLRNPGDSRTMAYTVKEVAAMSGVSVRTLHFYDESGLLKPARCGGNGYRYYEEAQLLELQQILFYRELGFELKEIRRILSRGDFEKIAALESHRAALESHVSRTRALIATIDKTIDHLKGVKRMQTEEMFTGFRVEAGKARFDEEVKLGGEPNDCKVSARDTAGALCVFEFKGRGGGPLHAHPEQDEWIYVLDGEVEIAAAGKRSRAGAGESVFLPRGVAHSWFSVSGKPVKILDVYQPAGKMEAFFREVGKYTVIHEEMKFEEFCRLFQEHGVELLGPPPVGEWKVEDDGTMVQVG